MSPTRRRIQVTLLATIAALAVGGVAGAVPASEPATITFGSSPDWLTFDQNRGGGNPHLGPAQLVCMNSFSPFPCPAGATDLGAPFSGWFADRSAIPGAEWIWAPGIDGTSSPAELRRFSFTTQIRVNGHPTAGSLSLAADDFAEARVNGHRVGAVGSVVDPGQAGAHNFLTTFDITDELHPGVNRITIRAKTDRLRGRRTAASPAHTVKIQRVSCSGAR